ncbi:transposase [Actinomyces sp.]|uniref:transposase n=2 Tax=unclassified Actinomyces TaxID=2609248 RepID=UPI0009F65B32
MRVMAPPRKCSVELQQPATRMVLDARKDPETSRGAIWRVADQLGVHPEALRNWVRHAEVDDGLRPGITTEDQARITELEREVRELRRANEILKTSAAFLAPAELDRRRRQRRLGKLTPIEFEAIMKDTVTLAA